jgi:hypothetical protein
MYNAWTLTEASHFQDEPGTPKPSLSNDAQVLWFSTVLQSIALQAA